MNAVNENHHGDDGTTLSDKTRAQWIVSVGFSLPFQVYHDEENLIQKMMGMLVGSVQQSGADFNNDWAVEMQFDWKIIFLLSNLYKGNCWKCYLILYNLGANSVQRCPFTSTCRDSYFKD